MITLGAIAATLTITGATNAAPIVITTATPHLLLPNAVVLVSGVVGNTAANDFWAVTPVDATHLSLQNSVGNGNYVSGGIAQTALVGGKILFGRRWVQQNQGVPRIVAVPIEAPILPRDQYAISDRTNADLTDAQEAALIAPAVSVTHNVYEIHCWGAQNPSDPDLDFDATEAIRDQVIRSADELYRGNFTTSGGKWIDQAEKNATEMKFGHLMVFNLTIDSPITAFPNVFAGPSTPGFIIDALGLNQGPSGELAAEIVR